jgi:chromosomal replication initiation ATPase DnaA
MLSKNRKDWLRYYRKWVSIEDEGEVSERLSGAKWPVCLGPQEFIERIKERYGNGKIKKDVPSSRELLPDKSRILEEVYKAYNTTESEIIKMQRGKLNEARNVAIYLTRKLRRDTLKEIGFEFNIDNDSTVSSVMERVKKKLEKDRKFYSRVDEIANAIQKR